jgi:hypothetical protein
MKVGGSEYENVENKGLMLVIKKLKLVIELQKHGYIVLEAERPGQLCCYRKNRRWTGVLCVL